jgi:hypothetical protein
MKQQRLFPNLQRTPPPPPPTTTHDATQEHHDGDVWNHPLSLEIPTLNNRPPPKRVFAAQNE